MASKWRALSYRKSYDIVARSLESSARRSISTLRCWAATPAAMTSTRKSSNISRSSGVASAISCCSIDANAVTLWGPSSRNVGISIASSNVRSRSGTRCNVSHGANSVSSSTALRHCCTSVCAHQCASSVGRVAEMGTAATGSRLSTSSVADNANRVKQACVAASVAGALAQADAKSFSSLSSSACAVGGDSLAASLRTLKVSKSPSKNRAPKILSSISASSPGRNVSRWPARLPLSTDET